jgi:nucleoprotein TPR
MVEIRTTASGILIGQNTENRLQSDFRTVQAERTRLTQLIENLNGVSTEHDRTRQEERGRLEKRVAELQQET